MKKAFYLAVFAVLFFAASQEVSAQAAQDFALVNQTGVSIYQLHVSPSDTKMWEMMFSHQAYSTAVLNRYSIQPCK
ncbi:MAG: hypothetical protein IPL67_18635 [Ignavibacteria bacterium]|nr:hypothetical protein [Ignavibacteria bacterium]